MDKEKNTVSVKDICSKIESIAEACKNSPHELLYERSMLELLGLEVRGIFIPSFTGITLHRIRLNEETNAPFEKLQDISYPPSKFVNNYGRVNRPGQPMFYCSEVRDVCELELLHDYLLKNKIGHERLATYTEWEIKKELNLLILAIAESNQEICNGLTVRNECFEFVKKEPEASKEHYSNQYTLTKHFFTKNAKSDNSVYVICSAIANLLTLYNGDFDGFIFPSVQGRTGYNIVLRPHVLDRKMIIPKKEIYMQKWLVSDKNLMKIDETYSKRGIVDGDLIVWDK